MPTSSRGSRGSACDGGALAAEGGRLKNRQGHKSGLPCLLAGRHSEVVWSGQPQVVIQSHHGCGVEPFPLQVVRRAWHPGKELLS